MSTIQPPPPGAPPEPGRTGRRPPTIDLTATELESKPVTESEPAAKSAAAAPSEPSGAGATVPPQPPPGMNAGATDPAANPASGANFTSSGGRAAWLPPNVPWLPIGAGVAGGAVVLAVLGIANLVAGFDTSASSLNARLAGLEQRVRDIAARPLPAAADTRALDDVAARLAKLEAAAATSRPGATDPALANRIAAIEGQIKALGETVSILGRRTDEAVTAARDARQRAEASTAALADLTQKGSLPGAPGIERKELEALANRVAAVERSEKAVEAELAKRPPAEVGDRSLRLVVAATALKTAAERGDPFAAELAAVKALAADGKSSDPKNLAALEPLAASGLPSAAALSRELSGLATSLLQAAGVPPRDGGILEKLQAGAEKLVRIRPIDDVAGNDPAAIVARIEARASQEDISGALVELAKLPPAARAPAEAWIKKAQMRMAALESSRRISADALAGLGK
jgi:hypothetical protein